MEKSEIWNTVKKIRRDCDKKSQQEQIEEHYTFFDTYPAIFFMARDKSMNLKVFEQMLQLKSEIDNGNVEKEQVDKELGTNFYNLYVKPNLNQ